jgi:hypothetical protein
MKKLTSKVSVFIVALMLFPLSTYLFSQAECTKGETVQDGNRRATVWHCNNGDYMTISVKQSDGSWKPVYDEPIQ